MLLFCTYVINNISFSLIEKYKTNMGANSATPAKEVTTKKVELKKNGDDLEEKVVQEQPSTKGQKKRLLNILVRNFIRKF